jgi:hypothetical protein
LIVSEIKGGLGNQLFQYAAGLALAKHHNASFILDKSGYDDDPDRQFGLNCFSLDNIKTEIATENDDDIYFTIYVEPFFHFDSSFFDNPDFTYLSGYWQTEKYFQHITTEIKNSFRIKPDYTAHLPTNNLAFDKYQSVSLHVRRTDYAVHPLMGMLTATYYYNAIDLLKQHYDNLKFYIFSDDIGWVKENLELARLDYVFVSGIYTKTNIEDFYLMQQCKHHIIANSTFSWWAAWLCNFPNKQVIAPANWFLNRPQTDVSDLIPANWLKLVW